MDMDIVVGIVVIGLVSYYIIKGYSASGVLLVGGIALLIATIFLGKGSSIVPTKESTGWVYLDILEFIKLKLLERGGGLGMLIMVLCGFSVYMTHIGANDMVVKLASKPLQYVKSPYFLMLVAYFASCLMSFAVSSATGLGVLLMATLYPIMVNMGLSKGSSAAICASPAAIILSPTSGDVILAAETSGVPISKFAFGYTLPISISAIVVIAISHFFWQRYLDKKEGFDPKQAVKTMELEVQEIKTQAPKFYALLPFTPIIGVVLFDGKIAPKLHIITIVILCMLITCLVEFLRSWDGKKVLKDLETMYQGMADAFSSVVVLLVAAGVFAQGLTDIGFIQTLINSAESMGNSGVIMMLALAVITLLAAIVTGSGNAPFYAFIELVPKLALRMHINPSYLAIPMLQSSNIGRSLSPVSGVLVAISSMAGISPFYLVKRMSVPMIMAFITVIIGTQIMV